MNLKKNSKKTYITIGSLVGVALAACIAIPLALKGNGNDENISKNLPPIFVTSGEPRENGIYTEIIDILNPNHDCKDFPNTTVIYAFSGVLNNSYPLICGGIDVITLQSDCYIVGETEITTSLLEPRFAGASIVIKNDSILWVTGGRTGSQGVFTETTEFVKLNEETIPGPNLTEKYMYHCITKINESMVVFIGGYYTEKSSLLVDIENDFEMESGPELINERFNHACGTIEWNETTLVIAIGGRSEISKNSMEIWDPNSDIGWEEGPDLVEPCSYSTLITSMDGKTVYLLGCFENPESIYELYTNENGILSWKKTEQKLKYPRSNTIAMSIPDEFVICNDYLK